MEGSKNIHWLIALNSRRAIDESVLETVMVTDGNYVLEQQVSSPLSLHSR